MNNRTYLSFLFNALLLCTPLLGWAQNNSIEQSTIVKNDATDKSIENEVRRLKGILNESSLAFQSKKHYASVDLYKLYTLVKNYDSAWRYLHLSDTVYVYNHGGCGSAIERAALLSSKRHAELYGLIGDTLNMEKSLLRTILIAPSDESNSDRSEKMKTISILNRSLLRHSTASVLKREFAKAIKTSHHDPNNEDKYPECQPYIIFMGTKMYLEFECNSNNSSANEQVIKKGLFYKMLMELPNK